MLAPLLFTFVLGYILIVVEHPLKLDKCVPALLMAAICWAFASLFDVPLYDHHHDISPLNDVLLHHIGKTAEILIFLLGAMTIVELVDLHKGFAVITDSIKTRKKSTLLYLVSTLGFFLSATLDNLASTIVLVSLLRRLVPNRKERLWFISVMVIAVNAGGAWSPIGDVTTTMLWIGDKVSTGGLIVNMVIPSIVCAVVPVFIAGRLPVFRGNITGFITGYDQGQTRLLSSRIMLYVGVGALILVPIFKTITHLPPYVGMMFSLGIVWLVSEYINPLEDFSDSKREMYKMQHALSRIEMSSIIFFLGILMAVAALESTGLLRAAAEWLDQTMPNRDVVVMILGCFSAVIDNVPLVAASMGMYSEPIDAKLWHFIAYAAGTGGSMLIIGSAAGVAAMGMEKIDFIWYFKKVTWLAFIGFLAGAAAFLVMQQFI